MTYKNTQLLINNQWCDAASGKSIAVVNPATGLEIGRVAQAGIADLDRALESAKKGFEIWRNTTVLERSGIMRKAAVLMRERAADIGG
jgi:succinate-semialdehyde dehydrogenase / glutarate-semialdehyde dehydrogenase